MNEETQNEPGSDPAMTSATVPKSVANAKSRGIAGIEDIVPPTLLSEIELSKPLPSFEGADLRRFKSLLALVRLHGSTIGHVSLDMTPGGLSNGRLAGAIDQRIGHAIRCHLRSDNLPEDSDLSIDIGRTDEPRCRDAYARAASHGPSVSIVVATRDRPEPLAACLDSLLDCEYTNYEILVVDNAPDSLDTSRLIKDRYGNQERIRYVCEKWPGPSAARNTGIAAAYGQIVACTDDDCIVDREWLGRLAARFMTETELSVVTGLILPFELETDAQVWLEQWGGFGKGYEPRTFDLGRHRPDSPVFPYATGMLGSGANMAFRQAAVREIGGFDPALGPATPTRAGEDLDLLFRFVMAGHVVGYEPSAIIRHRHRRDMASLRKVVGDGSVLTYLTKYFLAHPRALTELIHSVPAGLKYSMTSGGGKNLSKGTSFPPSLNWIERRAMLVSPALYLLSLWSQRRLSTTFGRRPPVLESAPQDRN